jgi:glycosyltransferase involved in cell wall biosynthesis
MTDRKKLRVLFVASGPNVPSTRFRVLAYLPALRAAGHRCDVAMSYPPKYDTLPWLGFRLSQSLKLAVRRFQSLRAKAANYDAIVIEREVFDNGTSEIEERLRAATRRLILDVDDAVFLTHPDKFKHIASMSDAVVAGNRYIADVCRPFCDHVTVIPTCISMDKYPRKNDTDAKQKGLVIGWMGTDSNLPFLKVCAPALKRLAKEIHYQLLVVAASPEPLRSLDLAGVTVAFESWSAEREIEQLQRMDIGLMPLPSNDPWVLYKCGAKLIQYLAVATPAVASPIGVNQEILGSGSAGRTATDDEAWFESLKELAMSAELRRQLGDAGRAIVQDRFSIEANVSIMEHVLHGQAD